jgi:hypothetical protein
MKPIEQSADLAQISRSLSKCRMRLNKSAPRKRIARLVGAYKNPLFSSRYKMIALKIDSNLIKLDRKPVKIE